MNNSTCSPSCCVNKHLFTRQSGEWCAIHLSALQITFIHLAVMLTEVQLYMSTSCQPGSRPGEEILCLF